jgi:hypothetical protein
MALVFDTGPIVAALNRKDRDHRSCAALIKQCDEQRVIPASVLPEVDYLCRKYLGSDAFPQLLDEIERGVFIVEALWSKDYSRVKKYIGLMRMHALVSSMPLC